MSRRVHLTLITTLLVCAPGLMSGGELRLPRPGDEVARGQFVVHFAKSPTPRTQMAEMQSAMETTADVILAATGLESRDINVGLSYLTIEVPVDEGGMPTPEGTSKLEEIAALDGVEQVAPAYTIQAFGYTPSDPLASDLWYFRHIGITKIARTQSLRPKDSTPVRVAIIDDGVWFGHPDLKGLSSGLGWDFVGKDADPSPDFNGQAWDTHGTHVAGSLAALWDNGEGIAGLCPNAEISAYRAFGGGQGTEVDGAAAIERAVRDNARLINCSWGVPAKSLAIEKALEKARDAGVLVICAAGNKRPSPPNWNELDNDKVDIWPANSTLENVISVANTTRDDVLYPGLKEYNGVSLVGTALEDFGASHYGKTTVDLAGPGTDILSTVVTGGSGRREPGYLGGDVGTGTSMASPIVCGAVAELINRDPSLTNAEIRVRLLASVERLPSLKDRVVSGGRLDVERLLRDVNAPPVITGLDPVVIECDGETNSVTLKAQVYDPDGQAVTIGWSYESGGLVIESGEISTSVFPTGSPGKSFEETIPLLEHGAIEVTFDAFDGSATTKRSITVTYQDTTGPVITTAPDIVVPTDPARDVATGVVLSPKPNVTDLCDGDPTLVPTQPDVYKVGVNVVTWTATDADGNVSTSTQRVIVEDREPPTIAPMRSIVQRVDRGETYATVSLGAPTFADNVDVVSVTADEPADFRFPVGTTIVTWTVADEAGNTASTEQVITVTNAIPVAKAGSYIHIGLTPDNQGRITMDGAGSSDEDGHDLVYRWSAPGVSFSQNGSARAIGLFVAGTTRVVLTVTDECGDSATSEVYVTVDPGRIRDFRALAPTVSTYTFYAYLYAYYAWAGSSWNENLYAGFIYSYFGLVYDLDAGDVLWRQHSEFADRLGDYSRLRGYQCISNYQAGLYMSSGMSLSPGEYAYYGMLLNYYSYLYGQYDF